MYYIIVKQIMDYLIKNKKIKSENEKRVGILMEYAVSLAINLFIAIGVGYTLNMETGLIVFATFYTVLRTSVGGCFYKINVKNSIMTWIMGIVIIAAMNYLINEQMTTIISIMMLVFSIGMTMILTRLNMHELDVSVDVKNNIKFRSIVTIIVESFILAIAIAFSKNTIAIAGVVGVFSQSMMIMQWMSKEECLVEVNNYA